MTLKLRIARPIFLFFLGPLLISQDSGKAANKVIQTKTIGLSEVEIPKAFDWAYGQLNSTLISPGTFYLVWHEGTSRRLLEGKLILFSSSVGMVMYYVVTIKGSGTYREGTDILRNNNSQWAIDNLDLDGNESMSRDIKTDNQTMAWCTQGFNFVESQVWQRINEECLADKYLERELTKAKLLVDSIVSKRIFKP